MLSAATLALAATITLNPSDDVWVYKFAADQTSDPYLRCWGSDGKSVADPGAGEAGSWSVMKFDVSKVNFTKLTGAELDLYFVPNPNIDEETGKKYPIEVRLITPKFEEENFELAKAEAIRPSNDQTKLLAKAPVVMYANTEGPAKITVKFTAESFSKALTEAKKSETKELAFAITTALTPTEAGESLIYKFYSTNSAAATKPTLKLFLD
jgi:hypothetical protein